MDEIARVAGGTSRPASTLIVGIDATNLRAGGGLTHLIEILESAEPAKHGIREVVVWAGKETQDKFPNRSWLRKVNPPALNRSLLHRIVWQRLYLSDSARAFLCDVLFVPGGSYAGDFGPVVTMSRNLLPFEWVELRRCGLSLTMAKLVLLRHIQAQSYRKADAVVFLSKYAKHVVERVTGKLPGETIIIAHGVNPKFRIKPREPRPVTAFTESNPCRLIYVSTVDHYKHQWNVVEAIYTLRRDGLAIALDLIGPANPAALARLNATIKKFDPEQQWVRYAGATPYDSLHAAYQKADIAIFASSCENLPNTLLEKMAAGLPVACSNRGPMPEILGDAGVYFDPEDSGGIAFAVRDLLISSQLRREKAEASFRLATQYSWSACADNTLSFICRIARRSHC